MQQGTLQLLRDRGYTIRADGRFARDDSHMAAPKADPVKPGAKRQKEPKKKREPSPLALRFEEMWKALGFPELRPEFKFHEHRKWRFDYVHLDSMVAVELEGGIFCRGRHSRPRGMPGDCDMYNAAAELGFHVFRLTTGQVTRERLEMIARTIITRSNAK